MIRKEYRGIDKRKSSGQEVRLASTAEFNACLSGLLYRVVVVAITTSMKSIFQKCKGM